MVGTIVHQLTRNLTEEQIKEAGFEPYFVDHTTGVFPQFASGYPWSASTMQVTGDTIADLTEDLAAEQKARVTYDNILRLSDDPDVNDVIRFLRARGRRHRRPRRHGRIRRDRHASRRARRRAGIGTGRRTRCGRRAGRRGRAGILRLPAVTAAGGCVVAVWIHIITPQNEWFSFGYNYDMPPCRKLCAVRRSCFFGGLLIESK